MGFCGGLAKGNGVLRGIWDSFGSALVFKDSCLLQCFLSFWAVCKDISGFSRDFIFLFVLLLIRCLSGAERSFFL